MTTLDVALDLIAEGVSVIPLQAHSKKPALEWKEYQEHIADESTVRTWFAGTDYNIGVVCGRVSGNLTVVDLDSAKVAKPWIDLYRPLLSGAPFIKTGREECGIHVWTRTDVVVPCQKRQGFDIKGEGGYVVCPPSIHPSGKAYELIEGDLCKIPTVEAALLDLLPTAGGDGQRMNEPGWQDLILKGDVTEGERHVLIGKLIGRWLDKGLTDPEILAAALGTTARWKPPLAEDDIKAMIASIRKTDERNHPPAAPLVVMSIADILQAPPVEWLIEYLLFDRTFSILGGYTGYGKSLLSLAIARSVADGFPLFGKYQVKRTGSVLLVDQENSHSDLRDRMLKMKINEGLPLYFLSFQNVRLDEAKSFAQLVEVIQKINPLLVIFDSLIRFHHGNENDSSEMALVMERLRQIVNCGPGVLVQHHHTKALGPLEIRARGSSDIIGASDVEYSLYKDRDDHLVLQTVKSRREAITPITLEIVEEGGELFFRCLGTGIEQKQELRQMILECLREPLGVVELSTRLANAGREISDKTLRQHLAYLVDKAQVCVSTGKRNRKEYQSS